MQPSLGHPCLFSSRPPSLPLPPFKRSFSHVLALLLSFFLFCHFLSFLSSLPASFTSNYPVRVKGKAFPSVSLARPTHTHTHFVWPRRSTCSTCLAEHPCSAALCKHTRMERRDTFNIHTWKPHLRNLRGQTHTRTRMCVYSKNVSAILNTLAFVLQSSGCDSTRPPFIFIGDECKQHLLYAAVCTHTHTHAPTHVHSRTHSHDSALPHHLPDDTLADLYLCYLCAYYSPSLSHTRTRMHGPLSWTRTRQNIISPCRASLIAVYSGSSLILYQMH